VTGPPLRSRWGSSLQPPAGSGMLVMQAPANAPTAIHAEPLQTLLDENVDHVTTRRGFYRSSLFRVFSPSRQSLSDPKHAPFAGGAACSLHCGRATNPKFVPTVSNLGCHGDSMKRDLGLFLSALGLLASSVAATRGRPRDVHPRHLPARSPTPICGHTRSPSHRALSTTRSKDSFPST